jgi:hypothetical protein
MNTRSLAHSIIIAALLVWPIQAWTSLPAPQAGSCPAIGSRAVQDCPDSTPATEPAAESEALAEPSLMLNGGLVQGFDDITTLSGAGWVIVNMSNPLGSLGWFQGNNSVFSAHNGAVTSYIAANYNSTAGTGTISNWLLTPVLELRNNAVLGFWTRTVADSPYPDRLQVRLSLNGASTNVGATATSVGDFTRLLLDLNPSYVMRGYPEVWTYYNLVLTGLGTPTSGRLAFRYFVENGGPAGTASNYIGIDTVQFTPAPALSLEKTVGLNPTSCASSTAITITAPTQVTYCYFVTNTGLVTLTVHSLVDDRVGSLLLHFPYALAPGASAFLTHTATIPATTVNSAIWTAYTAIGQQAVSSDTATVNFIRRVHLPLVRR